MTGKRSVASGLGVAHLRVTSTIPNSAHFRALPRLASASLACPFLLDQYMAPVRIGAVLFILEIKKPMAHIAANIRNSIDCW